MIVRHLTPAEYRVMPWRNGRGSTVELAREDDDAGLLWRLSRADVIEDGEFSMFPGIDRILMLIDGPGFDLDFAENGRVSVPTLSPIAFSGDWVTRAEHVRGASRDLNLMLARGRARGEMLVRPDGFVTDLAEHSLFLVLHGDWRLDIAGQVYDLGPDHLLTVNGSGPVSARGSGHLIEMRIALIR